MLKSSVEEVRGTNVIIRFDGAKCIHSRHCVLDRPDVFVPNVEGEWIHPDHATPEGVAEIARNCPSGAITFERLDGGADEAAPLVNVVGVRENGPLAFHANLTITGHGASLRATLCRCGASANKPFCDGSHSKVDFKATGEPAIQESQLISPRNGPVTVEPRPNGPLKVIGALEVCSGTGRTVIRGTETWLCRCGGSANKPFCDGTHRKNAFQST
jgi:CDGSH-type Zn-finger protein/uncharacterized Fe-S cluster protein YjdI